MPERCQTTARNVGRREGCGLGSLHDEIVIRTAIGPHLQGRARLVKQGSRTTRDWQCLAAFSCRLPAPPYDQEVTPSLALSGVRTSMRSRPDKTSPYQQAAGSILSRADPARLAESFFERLPEWSDGTAPTLAVTLVLCEDSTWVPAHLSLEIIELRRLISGFLVDFVYHRPELGMLGLGGDCANPRPRHCPREGI